MRKPVWRKDDSLGPPRRCPPGRPALPARSGRRSRFPPPQSPRSPPNPRGRSNSGSNASRSSSSRRAAELAAARAAPGDAARLAEIERQIGILAAEIEQLKLGEAAAAPQASDTPPAGASAPRRRRSIGQDGRLDRRLRRDPVPELLAHRRGRRSFACRRPGHAAARRRLHRIQVRRPLALQQRARVRERRRRLRQGRRGGGRVRVRRLHALARRQRARRPVLIPDGSREPSPRADDVSRSDAPRRRAAHPPLDLAGARRSVSTARRAR